jgi:solute carrier family 25 S-adenosylmethionine transporter 26
MPSTSKDSRQSGFVDGVAGGAAGALTELIFYSLDSAKIQMQAGKRLGNLSSLFKGMAPTVLAGSAPSFAAFFATFTPLKNTLNSRFGRNDDGSANATFETLNVLAASILAGVPSSLVSVPSDVVKKRLLLNGGDATWGSTARSIWHEDGLRGFMVGWRTNLVRDIAFAAIKMTLYEGCSRIYLNMIDKPLGSRDLNHNPMTDSSTSSSSSSPQSSQFKRTDSDHLKPIEAAAMGLVSGALTAVITQPIDCVNTRIKSGELASFNIARAHAEIVRRDGVQALFRGLTPRMVILGVGSTVFWYWFAKVRSLVAATHES